MSIILFIILLIITLIFTLCAFYITPPDHLMFIVASAGMFLYLSSVLWGAGLQTDDVNTVEKINIDANTVQENYTYNMINDDNDSGINTLKWLFIGAAFIMFGVGVWHITGNK